MWVNLNIRNCSFINNDYPPSFIERRADEMCECHRLDFSFFFDCVHVHPEAKPFPANK
jgi:hypothetical protein